MIKERVKLDCLFSLLNLESLRKVEQNSVNVPRRKYLGHGEKKISLPYSSMNTSIQLDG